MVMCQVILPIQIHGDNFSLGAEICLRPVLREAIPNGGDVTILLIFVGAEGVVDNSLLLLQ